MFETLAHYRVLDSIGAGGMGEVFRARDTRLGRTVAVKVLPDAVAHDPERRDRFLREARATAALSHPNIAALYEIGEDRGHLFLAFEFVPGDTLNVVIGGHPMNPRRALDLGVQMADAIADAHAAGIVHRDIKPANVIVTPKGNAKILDFGLATWTAGGSERDSAADAATVLATKPGTALGTAAYMSPEQALGDTVDHRTDIFSLGIVLFEMLTGTLPFAGKTATALALQIVQAPAPALSSVNASLPRELDAIVAKALAKQRDRRYESAAGLAADLRSVAATLDVRSAISEPASAPAVVLPRRWPRSAWIWALIIVAIAATAWVERVPLQRMWRRTIGPATAPVIAVMPLELAGVDASQTYFADGLTEDLISRLGQTRGLKVIGRSPTREYRGRTPRDVAREIGAGVVLTGSVRPSADTVKISLELIDPSDGTAIWSKQYTREVKDIFAVQAQVAEDVAQALRLTLQPTASSARATSRLVDARAYELYLRGRQAAAARNIPDAIDLYEQAIAVDAGLAEAQAGLAEALHFGLLRGDGDYAALQRRLNAAAERAYQLDPDLPQANLAMGVASDALSKTLEYMRKALELDRSFSEAYHQIGDQIQDVDPERALAFYAKSVELDPRLVITHADSAITLTLMNRWADARAELDKQRLALERRGVPDLGATLGFMIDVDEHRFDAAIQSLNAFPGLRTDRLAWRTYVLALRGAGRSADAFREAPQLVRAFPTMCSARALLAGLTVEAGEVRAGRELASPIIAAARAPLAPPAAVRCGVLAAAALGDGSQTGTLLQQIAGDERRLRGWALEEGAETGGLLLRGRVYPWSEIVTRPQVIAARKLLDAAYARQREVAQTVLAGLP
jgi:TolB-like protein